MPPPKRTTDAALPRAKRLMTQTMALLQSIPVVPSYTERIAAVELYRQLELAMQPLIVSMPHMPDDLMQLILEHRYNRRTMATFGERGSDGVRVVKESVRVTKGSGRIDRKLRLVCRQWARCVGRLVESIVAPNDAHISSVSVFNAFPNVFSLDLGEFADYSDDGSVARIEDLLARYMARPGSRFTVYAGATPERQINVAGAYLYDQFESSPDVFDCFTNVGAPIPIYRTRNGKLQSTQWTEAYDIDYALSHVDTITLFYITKRTIACNFRARQVRFGHSGMSVDAWNRPALCALLDPARWVDGKLPQVRVNGDFALIDALRSLVPADHLRVYGLER